MPISDPAALVGLPLGATPGAALTAVLVPSRNFHPAASFSAQKTATELGREVSACQS